MVTKKSAKPPAVPEGPSPVRARILEAAFSAFMERGFAESSTLEIATRAYVLEEGRIAAEGAPGELLASPHIRRAYLGESTGEAQRP